jgi:ribosomal protein S18 acetylase RimI-like enzyme
MKTTFRKANPSKELQELVDFDRKVFEKADRFPKSQWREYKSYWMIVDGKKAGCCAFEHNVDFQKDPKTGESPPLDGSLYIATTAILPPFRRKGLGDLLKVWQISYARHHGFTRIVTNSRKSNRAMIELNKKFGFTAIETVPGYYSGKESAVVMEKRLTVSSSS